VDEVDLVALAVPEEVVHRLGGTHERDLDVVVPHQQPTAGDLVALGLEPPGPEVPVRVCVRHPFLALDRLEVAQLLHAAGRGEVVQDRLVAGEALEAHDLLGQERPVLAELDVPLAREITEALVERHRREDTPG
jgi:hypothetical protein